MASTARKLQTNFTKGELSPRLECRPDLAAYFNGASVLENYFVFPQGGIYRAPGTKFLNAVKDSTAKTRLIPFIFNRSLAYVLEVGNEYIRFYKNSAQIMSGGFPFEIATSYLTANLFELMLTQSVDVLFIDHQSYHGKKLSRASDTSWAMSDQGYRPPASFEDLTDIGTAAAATLTPAATTGTSINFTASVACFLESDTGRSILYGTSRAVITGFTSTTVVVADITDAFPSTAAIPAGSWFLDKSPDSWLSVNKRKPVGGSITVTGKATGVAGAANKDTFRAEDVNKFISLAGGLVEINGFTSAPTVTGVIRASLVSSELGEDNVIKRIAPGDWLLRVKSWDATHGFPKTPFFYQGRQGHASSLAQPTSWWLSATDSYENYAIGGLATDAVDYTVTARQLNQIVWGADIGPLILGTAGGIWLAKGPGTDQPLGGDVVPFMKIQDAPGSAAIQPLVIGTRVLYVHASGKAIIELVYNTDAFDNSYRGIDVTRISEHIVGEDGLAVEQIAYAETPNKHVFFPRVDGQLVCLTYFPYPEQVQALSRRTTQGVIESHCVIPHPDGDRDQHWMIVNRTINGATVRCVEVVDDNAFPNRAWHELNTDCAKTGTILAGATTITGLSHLEAATVDVLLNGSDAGQFVVSGGIVTLNEAVDIDTDYEVGLHYESTATSMRPALQDAMIEGLPRKWNFIQARMLNSIGGTINGKRIHALTGADPMDTSPPLFTGDTKPFSTDWDDVGKITIKQDRPYPHTVLGLFGELVVGDRPG